MTKKKSKKWRKKMDKLFATNPAKRDDKLDLLCTGIPTKKDKK